MRSKVELGKKRGGRNLFLAWSFFVTILLSFIIGKELIFPRLSLSYLQWYLVNNVCVFISMEELSHHFSAPVLLRRGTERATEWASGSHARLTPL